MIHIRKAEWADIQHIKNVEDDCFSLPWNTKSFQTFINNSQTHSCYVAVDSDQVGRIVGYIAAIHTGPEAEIANIAVIKTYQNQGIGDQLVSFILSDLKGKGVRCIFLEVRKSNAAAIHLYQKKGFNDLGIRKKYYNEPVEDALVLRHIFDRKENELNKKRGLQISNNY